MYLITILTCAICYTYCKKKKNIKMTLYSHSWSACQYISWLYLTVLAPHYQASLLTADPEQKANIIYLSKWIFTTIELKSITYHMQVLQRIPLQSYLVTTNTLYFNFTFLEYKWFCPTTGSILWIRLTDGLREASKGATGPPTQKSPILCNELLN